MNMRIRNLLAVALGTALVAPLAISAPQSLTGVVRGQVGVPIPQTRLPTRPVERAVDRTADALERARERARDERDMADSVAATAQATANAAAHSEVMQRDLWARLDADGDGRISTDEARADAGFATDFAAMDSDGDGFVGATEFRAHAHADVDSNVGMDGGSISDAVGGVVDAATDTAAHSMAAARGVRATLDADGDGRISAAEAQADAGFAASFEAMDADGDGFVTQDERRDHARTQRDPDAQPRDYRDDQ